MAGTRQYEAIVLGATGYTGKYTAEHITTSLPTDFKWALAGRSEGKLRSLAEDLKSFNIDRAQPGIEIAHLSKEDLVNLAKKTMVLITTIGPYHKYGTAIVEACAETGTHYLDCTGEVPWVREMIQKYQDVAKSSSAIMISQNGIESAPPDLLAWKLVSKIREETGQGTNEVVHTTYDMKATPSGGTLASLLGIFDKYSTSELLETVKPWCLCPVSPPESNHKKSSMERLTGVRTVSDLGTLTDSIQGLADVPIIHRSWGLYNEGKSYGPNFYFSAYNRTRNSLTGFGAHIALNAMLVALALPPVRWIMSKFVYAPGEGPSKEQVKNEYVEWRTIANADGADSKRAYGRMRWDGSMYHLTGALLAEAAVTISREKTYAHELGGGMLTPATLGERYLERMKKIGLKTEFRMLS